MWNAWPPLATAFRIGDEVARARSSCPRQCAAHSERDLWSVLVAPSPRLLIFLMSMTLGIFWIGQQTQLNQFARADRNLALNSYYLLCAVCRSRFRPRSLPSFTIGWRLSSTGSIFCRRRRPLLFQYLLQHRRDCSGASEPRRRPKILLGLVL